MFEGIEGSEFWWYSKNYESFIISEALGSKTILMPYFSCCFSFCIDLSVTEEFIKKNTFFRSMHQKKKKLKQKINF